MSSEQHDQQPQAATGQEADSRREFVKKGAVAAIGGAVSAIARVGAEAIRDHFFGDGS